jgi:putative endonuclease
MHDRQRLGAAGEDLAAEVLTAAGLDIRHRNWRASLEDVRGELDIVAVDGAALVLVEVRTRRTGRGGGTAAESVGPAKRRRLRRLASLYLQAHPHVGPVRGDVVTVEVVHHVGEPGTRVRHLRGAW